MPGFEPDPQASNYRLGVDLGGSKIEAVLLGADNQVLSRLRVKTPAQDYNGILHAVRDIALAVEVEAGLSATQGLPIGIGTPGSRSPASGLMRNCNSTALNGRRLVEDLGKACSRPVRLANDADCFALSESRDGAAAGYASAFGVIIGTGVGAGITVNGALLCGPNALCGEWGHNRLPLERLQPLPKALRKPRPCYCGQENCVETWISGPGLALTHQQLHGTPLQLEQLQGNAGDQAHTLTLKLYAEMLAGALAEVVNILDPGVIVLGGGLSKLTPLYAWLPELLQGKVFSDVFGTPVLAAHHGDSSGVRGAAWLWP